MTDLITKWPAKLHTLAANEVYFHTFETKYGPLSPNPYSTTRFALRGSVNSPNTRAAYYIASSIHAALWEVVLRGVTPTPGGSVYIAPAQYIGRSIATVVVQQPIPDVMRVDQPHRRRLVEQDSVGDMVWQMCCDLPVHEVTHGVAHGVDQFLAAQGVRHAGLGWRSRQYPDGTVYVLYAPPFAAADWAVSRVVDLNSAHGRRLIREAVEAAGFVWADPPDDGPSEPEVPTV